MISGLLVRCEHQTLPNVMKFNKDFKICSLLVVFGFLSCLEIWTATYILKQVYLIQEEVTSHDILRCMKYLNASNLEDLFISGDAICDRWLQEVKSTIEKQLNLDVKNKLMKELKAKNISFSNAYIPSIQLTGKNNRQVLKTETAPPYYDRAAGRDVLYWDETSGHSLRQGVIDYNKGEIHIPEDGLYFVYSQIYFRHALSSEYSETFVQYIYKKTSYLDPILLTKAVFTGCSDKNANFLLYSSYQGALFELKQEDRLFVKVTNAKYLSFEDTATHFGVFMLQ